MDHEFRVVVWMKLKVGAGKQRVCGEREMPQQWQRLIEGILGGWSWLLLGLCPGKDVDGVGMVRWGVCKPLNTHDRKIILSGTSPKCAITRLSRSNPKPSYAVRSSQKRIPDLH